MEPYEFLEDHRLVLNQFGLWPSFHDGEVLRLVLDRTARNVSGRATPTLEIQIQGWVMTSKISKDGSYKREHDAVVCFLFEDIFDFELEGFNQQNVLSSLNLALVPELEESGGAVHVELEHCFQFCGEFKARKAKVLSVAPHVPGEDG